MIVLRSTFDTLAGRVHALSDEVLWLRAQLEAKDEQIAAMRREGFDPPAPHRPVEPSTPEANLPKEIVHALESVAKPGDHLWLKLANDAQRDLSLDADPESVANSIRRGSDLNPYHM